MLCVGGRGRVGTRGPTDDGRVRRPYEVEVRESQFDNDVFTFYSDESNQKNL